MQLIDFAWPSAKISDALNKQGFISNIQQSIAADDKAINPRRLCENLPLEPPPSTLLDSFHALIAHGAARVEPSAFRCTSDGANHCYLLRTVWRETLSSSIVV